MKKIILACGGLLLAAMPMNAQKIFDAVKANDLAGAKALVEVDGRLVQAKDENGRTPLHWACRGVHMDILKYLVGKGADVNAVDSGGIAPIHSLATRGHDEGIAVLLFNKADVNRKDGQGEAALHYAVRAGAARVVRLLLDHGAAHSPKNREGNTPLNLALDNENKDIIDLLLDRKADYDGSGDKALIMLQNAAQNAFERMFKTILDREGGRLFAAKEKNIKTMQAAVVGGSVKIVSRLVGHGLPLDKKTDAYGWTLVHYAANSGKLAMIEHLVHKGLDINQKTLIGETAYNLAEKNGDPKAGELIVYLGGRKDRFHFPVLKGEYLGQKLPGTTPEIFAPGIVSSADFLDFKGAFSPDGREYYFYRHALPKTIPTLYFMKVEHGIWTEPAPLEITRGVRTFHPCVSSDNQRLFFLWEFGPGKTRPSGYYMAERTDTGWSAPQFVGQGMYLTSDHSGQFYTTTSVWGDQPKHYISKFTFSNGLFTNYERLKINPHFENQTHPCIAPDGSYLIFDVNVENGSLFVSFKGEDGSWGEAIDLTKHGFKPDCRGAYVSPDGKFLFFAVNGDIWWVDVKVIENLRPRNPPGLSSGTPG